jgi:lipooligosaccharide transport system ATP-binding protein
VLTTHFMDEAERLTDRLAILDHGRVVAEGAPRALIESHIEPAVVEVYGEGLDSWTHTHAGQVCQRFETVGETLFCYTTTPERVIEVLKQTPALRYLHRPSSLEDVFLKLTGRDLRD